jgi:folylpolyglutamate synthase/dihydropteroate synthase
MDGAVPGRRAAQCTTLMPEPDPMAATTSRRREILVAGTAGRSSISSMIAAILAGAGQQDAWIVRSDLTESAEPVELAVFAPILPAARGTDESAAAITQTMPPVRRAVTSLQRESVLDVLRPAYPGLAEVASLCRLSRGRVNLDGQDFRLKTPRDEYRIHLQVSGSFQVENAATAVLAVEQLGLDISPAAVASALAELRLPARCEILKRQPLVLVDAGSLTASLRRVCDTVRELAGGRHITLVLDLGSGLSPAGAVEAALPLQPELVAVLGNSPPETRTELREAAYDQDLALQLAPDIGSAVDAALGGAGPRDVVCVAGSRRAAAAARAQILGILPADSGPDTLRV